MSANNSPNLSDGDFAKRTAWAPVPPAYVNDPKYKKYTQQVEKCLSSFDSVHEWADFISFLKQLLKTFQSYMQFKEIPRKLVVAKRLSQCLNPALPTGVHQRALDVYAHILAVLGSEGLQKDLALWSSGLFPFFEYAATSVKPTLLNLFDTHYLPLQAGLRPIMKSFILALLPGLEEETGEFFDSVLGLLDKLSGTVSPSFFLQNIWLIMLTSPSARGTSLNYLSRRLPRLKPDEDITIFVGRDVGLMIRAISAALEDDDSLVRRSALDILLQSLPVDSIAVKHAPEDDRTILMRAATSVVLRRDLALNRRLYSWLLGTDENSQQQMNHLKSHALRLLTSTLKSEMYHPSADYSPSRPFKIFISLLDKWEIGSLLTEALVFDCFKALRDNLQAGADTGDDMSMTAATLYEAIEPHALWKELLQVAISDIVAAEDRSDGVYMVKYILATFHTHDEEIESLHLPVCFTAISETLTLCLQENPTRVSYQSTLESLALLQEIWKHIRLTSLKERPRISGDDSNAHAELGPYAFSCTFYGIEKRLIETPSPASPEPPLVSAFHHLTALSKILGSMLLDGPFNINRTQEAFSQPLLLLTKFAQQVQVTSVGQLSITWEPKEWLSTVLNCVQSKSATFAIVDHVTTTLVRLQAILRYLRPPWATYHMRAVTLIWALETSSKCPQVVSIISQSLTSKDVREVRETCEAFGVLWRLTDDAMTPGFRLKIPMMIVLETLRSDDPNLKRVGETWMRCSLKSYLRILDPFLYDLSDPSIRRAPCLKTYNGREIPSFTYERPMDQRYINHLLSVLLSVVKFGGQGFSKVAKTTQINRAAHAGLVERINDVGGSFPEATYMDVLVSILLRYIQSEPKPQLVPTMAAANAQIQSTVIDILQSLVARGDVDILTLQTAETVIIGKLFTCVHAGRLDVQNKLLHLLHSVISAFRSLSSGKQTDAPGSSYYVNPLLIHTLIDGIAVGTNRPVLQHWLDFILMTIPQFHDMLQPAIIPLSTCVCKQLSAALVEVKKASSGDVSVVDVTAFTTDADFVMLLNAVERLVLLSLFQLGDSTQAEEDGVLDKPAHDGSGILGYVSNVFSADGTSAVAEESSSIKASDYRCLYEAIAVLFDMWEQLAAPSGQQWGSREESLTLIYTRSRTRCRRVLEHLFREYSLEVTESIVDCWSRGPSHENPAAFELIDVLTSSAQNVVHMICESISMRVPGMPERLRKHGLCPTLSDITLFDFLEQYLRRLEGPVAVQVWSRFQQLTKEFVSILKEFRPQAYSTLRCFTVLADKMIQASAVEDRRVRKDLQDTYTKLVETCLLAGKSSDGGSWIIRRHNTLNVNGTGRDSPSLRGSHLDTKLDEKMNSSSVSLPEGGKPSWNDDIIEQINLYLASDVVPDMRKFLVDVDKVLGLCNSIVSSTVAPALKGRTRPLDVDETILSVLREMTRIGTAMKAWRGPIVDILNDNRCFNSTPEAGKKWRIVIKMLFEHDKTALTELLSKVTSAPSANIFANREYEMLLRSLNLRRLSYVLLTGEKNQFLTQLPTIQEKLVDALRNSNAPIVQSEVYLCVRILLCRLSPHNLSSFWPTILAELYRVFEQAIISLPSDGSEELGLVLAASKLLDLLLVLQTEEFQIHQWIFITDTVDAVYHPDNWTPAAMIDRLAEVVGELPIEGGSRHQDHGTVATPVTPTQGARSLRKPFLTAHQIDSIRDLVPFFNQASIASYESVYSSGGSVDWEAVEDGLYQDMFDGRAQS
ncbi:hypothetical protein NM688_g5613 [Phlebia brevispora]|uniref:Uncharacterized protein n=1 Tax=Phlebia brevispora TaxID=194682 RepID=A0ACC1ST11_9APHY|nr:hypothetical protein NM688_g5613 [Phlebia brevispora]